MWHRRVMTNRRSKTFFFDDFGRFSVFAGFWRSAPGTPRGLLWAGRLPPDLGRSVMSGRMVPRGSGTRIRAGKDLGFFPFGQKK